MKLSQRGGRKASFFYALFETTHSEVRSKKIERKKALVKLYEIVRICLVIMR